MKVHAKFKSIISLLIFSVLGNVKEDIEIRIIIESFLDIDEVDGGMGLKFSIILSWLDSRLQFLNLKPDHDLNSLSTQDLKQIWLPELEFLTTKNIVNVELNDYQTYGYVKLG